MVVLSSQYDWNSRNFVIPRAVNITNVRRVFSTDSEPPTSELGGWISYSLMLPLVVIRYCAWWYYTRAYVTDLSRHLDKFTFN